MTAPAGHLVCNEPGAKLFAGTVTGSNGAIAGSGEGWEAAYTSEGLYTITFADAGPLLAAHLQLVGNGQDNSTGVINVVDLVSYTAATGVLVFQNHVDDAEGDGTGSLADFIGDIQFLAVLKQ